MKTASWKINSIRLRLHKVEKLIKEKKIDLLCLQETFKIMKLFISFVIYFFISSCSFFEETGCFEEF